MRVTPPLTCLRGAAIGAFAILGSTSPVRAQDPPAASRWDVTEARGQTRTIDFTTSEGTEMSVDVSRDGSWIAFDLLAHIYRMPAAGGEAVALTQNSGVAVNYHPRISPDGRLIAFVSDRDGQNNLWLMNADGSSPRIVHRDLNVRVATPAWTPDGTYIIVRRQSLGGGGGGGGGLWMYHREGGEGVQLVSDGGAEWPTVSPDGRFLYYMVRSGADALAGGYQLRRFEFTNGRTIDITAGTASGAAAGRGSSGGAFAPEISPDGRWLAFARHIADGTITYRGHRFGPRTALWLLDLESGAQRVLMDPIDIAIESGSKTTRILPGYAWSADGRSIVLAQGGEIRRLDVAGGDVATIPFTARVQRTISGMAYAPFRIDDGPFTARFLRWPTSTPDGGRLAFQSVGRIWVAELPAGAPRRLTADTGALQEFAPAWSPDGQWIAYTTWHDTEGGHVWRMPAAGGEPVRLTADAGEYLHPAWSADSRSLVLVRGAGATRSGRSLTANSWWDVVTVPAAGGDLTLVTRVALPAGTAPSSLARRAVLQPSFGPDGRVFVPERAATGSNMVLVSWAPDGSDRREHIALPNADEIVPSPDGRWAAFAEGDNVYVTPLPYLGTGGTAVELNRRRGRLPVRALSTEGGLFPRWRDAQTLEFGSANRYFRHNVETQRTDSFSVALEVPRRVPAGSVALTGARIVTLRGDEVIESGTVVVTGARIACVGDCAVPTGAEVIDAAGATIIPGFVDMHAHHFREHRGFRPLRDYETAIYLAYGVTTSLDNSMWSQNIFPTAESIEAGRTIGPRVFSTGDPLYRGDGPRQNELSSLEATQREVTRLQSYGAVSLKQYQQPRRDQRQWVSHVARERGLMVTAESGDLWYNLSMIMDGQTGWEHPITTVPIYSDVAKFLGQAGAFYSPTFVVSGPGAWNINYFFAESDVWLDEKQRRWMPWRNLVGHLRRRELRPETDYSFPLIAEGLADIIAEGGFGAIGSHGEHHGLAPHWEVWMAASALGPIGALRVASLHGARFLGADRDLGSIEAGKLADLIVLRSNPLDDIRNTLDMRFVMKGGVLYDPDTLDEVWPERRPFGPYYWVDDTSLRADDVPFDVWRRR